MVRNLVPLVLGVLLAACSAVGSPGSPVPHTSQAAAGSPATFVERSAPAASAMPESTPTPSASRIPGTNLTPVPSRAPVVLSVGDHAQVVTNDLRLRSKPSVGSDSQKYEPLLQRGNGLWVLGGPVAGSGYSWYRVARATQWVGDTFGEGWVASAARDGTPWVASQPFAETVPTGALVWIAPGDGRHEPTREFQLPEGAYYLTFSGVPSCSYRVRFGTQLEFDLGFNGAILSTVQWPQDHPEPSMATGFDRGTSGTVFPTLPAGAYRLEITSGGSPTSPCPWGAALTL